MDQLTPKLIGARVQRREDRRLLTGQGAYVDDHHPPGLLHAAFLRSPYAHARIAQIDVASARALDGVAAVLTGTDLARLVKPVRAGSKTRDYKETSIPPLAVDKVRYVGEAVAVVVTESRYLAEDALEQISVDYDPLPVVADAEEASRSDTTLVHEEAGSNVLLIRQFAQGEVDAAI